MVGEVGAYGYDRDVAVGQSVFVGVLAGVIANKLTRHPPVGAADGVDAFFETVDPGGTSLSADTDAFDLRGVEAGDIDIECCVVGQWMMQNVRLIFL